MKRETKILVFDIGMSLLGTAGLLFNIWTQHRYEEPSELEPFSVRQAALGALSAVTLLYTDDHDWWAIRSSRKRMVLFALGWNVLIQKLDPEIEWSFGVGSSLGSLFYRVWFGIIRPIPEPRLEYPFLRRRK